MSLFLFAIVYFGLTFDSELMDFEDAFSGSTGFSVGDAFGALLWSAACWFTNPYQVTVLFLGRFEGQRPSDWVMARVSSAMGIDVNAAGYSPPLIARLIAVLVAVGSGTTAAYVLEQSLGEAQWSVSTGLGLCFLAGVFEAGRPKQLSAEETEELEELWQVFGEWADVKLQRKGQCHFNDISDAFRKYPTHGRFRSVDGLSDQKLRELIKNWHRDVRTTSAGFYKGLSLAPVVIQPTAAPDPEEKEEIDLEELLKS